jgi:hypothetical protein
MLALVAVELVPTAFASGRTAAAVGTAAGSLAMVALAAWLGV